MTLNEHPIVRPIAERAAESILAAIDHLPAHLMFALAWNLAEDDEPTLAAIGEAAAGGKSSRLAEAMIFAAFIGESTPLLERLADDTEPWRTIHKGISEVRSAVYDAWPGLQQRHERRRESRERWKRRDAIGSEDDDA